MAAEAKAEEKEEVPPNKLVIQQATGALNRVAGLDKALHNFICEIHPDTLAAIPDPENPDVLPAVFPQDTIEIK